MRRPDFPRLALIGSIAAMTLAGCQRPVDFDLRRGPASTARAAKAATAPRPAPDARGVISYSDYQVVVARRDETVAQIASRLGISAASLARHNGIDPSVKLRRGEIIALPGRLPTATPTIASEPVDVETLAGQALKRAENAPTPGPKQHRVKTGETAYSIARLYGVSATALATWNGLDGNRTVRPGQILLIPPRASAAPVVAKPLDQTEPPGTGTPTPTPPSASKPLPKTTPAQKKPAKVPAAPNIGKSTKTAVAKGKMLAPTPGAIIRAFKKGKSDGIDIAATANAPVKAAANGTVSAITADTDNRKIVVVSHPGNLLTVYANVGKISVKKGAKVKQGQTIAKALASEPNFVHFEVRKGFEAQDPVDYLD